MPTETHKSYQLFKSQKNKIVPELLRLDPKGLPLMNWKELNEESIALKKNWFFMFRPSSWGHWKGSGFGVFYTFQYRIEKDGQEYINMNVGVESPMIQAYKNQFKVEITEDVKKLNLVPNKFLLWPQAGIQKGKKLISTKHLLSDQSWSLIVEDYQDLFYFITLVGTKLREYSSLGRFKVPVLFNNDREQPDRNNTASEAEPSTNSHPRPAIDSKRAMEEMLQTDGYIIVKTQDLITAYWPSKNREFSVKDSAGLVMFLEKRSLGFEPDFRFGEYNFLNYEFVCLFKTNYQQLAISDEYSIASLVLYLASVVTRADGNIAREQKERLQEYLETKLELSKFEKVRLKAHVEWLLAEQPHFTGIKHRLQELRENERKAIGDFCVSVACADGKVEPEEVTTLHRIFRSLEISPDELNTKLREAKEKLSLKEDYSLPQHEEKPEIDTFLDALLQESRIRKLEMLVNEDVVDS